MNSLGAIKRAIAPCASAAAKTRRPQPRKPNLLYFPSNLDEFHIGVLAVAVVRVRLVPCVCLRACVRVCVSQPYFRRIIWLEKLAV